MYEILAKPIVSKVLEGYNGTILAYGQTSSGKTYSMVGEDNKPGIFNLAVKDIFKEIAETTNKEFLVRIGSLEIYNDKLYDLLDNRKSGLKIFESDGRVTITQKDFSVNSEDEVLELFHAGNKLKQVVGTILNNRSSRSHSIFRITVESRNANSEEVKTSNLFLVDLAGSEKPGSTKATFNEGLHINKSLLVLGRIIRELLEKSTNVRHVNFRECKLTRILSPALGGNSFTAVICNVSPTSLDGTYHTVCFAQNAKKAKTFPVMNTILRRSKEERKTLQSDAASPESRPNETSPLLDVISLSLRNVGSEIHSRTSTLNSKQILSNRNRDQLIVDLQEKLFMVENYTIKIRIEHEMVIKEKDQAIECLEIRLNQARKAVSKGRNSYRTMLDAKHDAMDTIQKRHDDELDVLKRKFNSLQKNLRLFEKALFDKEKEFRLMEARAYTAEEGLIEMKRNFDIKFDERQQQHKNSLIRKSKRMNDLENEVTCCKKREQEKKNQDFQTYIKIEKHFEKKSRRNFEEMKKKYEDELSFNESHSTEHLNTRDNKILKLENELFKSTPDKTYLSITNSLIVLHNCKIFQRNQQKI